MTKLLLFLPLAAGLVAYALWVYVRVELPVRGRRLLAAARAAALLLVLLLLFDPRIPGGPEGSGARWALLDASESMGVPGAGGAAVWEEAAARARALEEDGWRVLAFGGEGREAGVPEGPSATADSRLAPALLRAVEAGAEEVRVLTDLRIEDPVDAAAVLAAAPMPVSFERFGGGLSNAGIAAFRVEDASRRGDSVRAEVELFGEGGGAVSLELREEGRLVAETTVDPPAPGLVRRVRLALPAPEAEGRVRYTVRAVREGDAFAADDEGVAYAAAGYEEGALVLVSLAPDWEVRYLLPVLEEVSGLPVAGYLRAGPDRWVPLGRAVDRGAPVDSATVRRAAADAALLVVHGLAGGDAFGEALARRAGRALAWPVDVAGADALGVAVGAPRGGEWYASRDVPASPLAGDLTGARVQGLPPLSDLLPAREGGLTPLRVQLGGTGPGEPAVVLLEAGTRRVAVPLVRGFWRWGAREGDGRDAYRRLWAGVAGWLLAPDAVVSSPELRPSTWVTPRGEDVRWLLPDVEAPPRLVVSREGEVVVDTTLVAAEGARTGPLPPGSYTYRATSPDGDVLGEGRFDVAGATDELAPLPSEPEAATRSAGRGGPGGAGGRPLRTSPWPYLLVLLLLCAEWVGRRRAGLR